jgi:hypothetical protein
MKNFILKFLIFTSFIFSLAACGALPPGAGASGTWENTIKNTDGSTVITTLEIKEALDTFTGTMSAKVIGSESATLKLTTADLKLSGGINGKTLTITDIESDSDITKTYSRLDVSKDGNLITLSPGEVKFRKKDH